MDTTPRSIESMFFQRPLGNFILGAVLMIDPNVEIRKMGWYSVFIFPHTSPSDSEAFAKRREFKAAMEKLKEQMKEQGQELTFSGTGYGYSLVVDIV